MESDKLILNFVEKNNLAMIALKTVKVKNYEGALSLQALKPATMMFLTFHILGFYLNCIEVIG